MVNQHNSTNQTDRREFLKNLIENKMTKTVEKGDDDQSEEYRAVVEEMMSTKSERSPRLLGILKKPGERNEAKKYVKFREDLNERYFYKN